jgi:hypothetical protein
VTGPGSLVGYLEKQRCAAEQLTRSSADLATKQDDLVPVTTLYYNMASLNARTAALLLLAMMV